MGAKFLMNGMQPANCVSQRSALSDRFGGRTRLAPSFDLGERSTAREKVVRDRVIR